MSDTILDKLDNMISLCNFTMEDVMSDYLYEAKQLYEFIYSYGIVSNIHQIEHNLKQKHPDPFHIAIFHDIDYYKQPYTRMQLLAHLIFYKHILTGFKRHKDENICVSDATANMYA